MGAQSSTGKAYISSEVVNTPGTMSLNSGTCQVTSAKPTSGQRGKIALFRIRHVARNRVFVSTDAWATVPLAWNPSRELNVYWRVFSATC